jgi:hypothetical protein
MKLLMELFSKKQLYKVKLSCAKWPVVKHHEQRKNIIYGGWKVVGSFYTCLYKKHELNNDTLTQPTSIAHKLNQM